MQSSKLKVQSSKLQHGGSPARLLALVACILCAALLAPAQTTSAVSGTSAIYGQLFVKESTLGRSKVCIDTRGLGITNHAFQWNVTGGPTSCTLLIETSDDCVTFATASSQTCTTNGTYTTPTNANFYTVNLSALSGGTSPTITTSYRGYLPGQGFPVREAEGGTGTSTQFTAGSIVFRGSNSYAQDNANFFFDDTNNRLCLLSNTCTNTFDIGSGKFFVTSAGAATATAGVTSKADAAGNVAFTTQGATSQTADLLQAKNSGGTVLASVSSAGIAKGNRGDNNVPLSGTVKADYTVTTVANTVTETALNSYSIPASTLAANRVIRVTAAGTYSTANGTDTVTLRARIATTAWHSIVSTAASVTNAQWSAQWVIVVKTLGAGGDAESQLPWAFINSVFKSDPNTAVETIDTTQARTLDITAQWSAALAGNTISVRQFVVEVLN